MSEQSRNVKPIHPDVLKANRLRFRAQITHVFACAFMEEHERAGVLFDELAMRLGVSVNDIERMLDASKLPRRFDAMADAFLALDVEPKVTLHRVLTSSDTAEQEPRS